MRVHPAEEIPGEEGQIDLFYPIGPSANELTDGQIAIVTSALQQQGPIPFSAALGQDREPLPLLIPHSPDTEGIVISALLQYFRAVGCEQFTQDPLCSWTQVLT